LWNEDVAGPSATTDEDTFVERAWGEDGLGQGEWRPDAGGQNDWGQDDFGEGGFDWEQGAAYRTAAWDGQVTKYVTWDDDRDLSWENNDVSQSLEWNNQESAQTLSWDNNDDKQELGWQNDDVQESSWETDETAQNDLRENSDTARDVSWNNDDAQFGSWINNEPTQTLTWEDYEASQDLSWDSNHHTQNLSWNDDNGDAQLGTWDNNNCTRNQSLTWENYEAAQQLLWDNNDSNHNLTRNEHTLSAWNNDNAAVFSGDSASHYAGENDEGEGDVSAATDWNHNWGPTWGQGSFSRHDNEDDFNSDMFFRARSSKSRKSVAWSDDIAAISEPKSYFWNDNTEASPSSDRSEHETSEYGHEQHDYWGRGSAWTAGEDLRSRW